MKYLYYFLIIIPLPFLFSCNKNAEKADELFNREEWCKRIDITSDLIIFIPDIQNYTDVDSYTRYLEAIIDKILLISDNGFKIKAVVQAGDVTNGNSVKEWETAKRVFSKLDSKIPYIMCTGNHDYGKNGGSGTRSTYYSNYFNYTTNSAFAASFEKDKYDNSFFRISIHEHTFQIFSLEFAPTDEVIAWADSIANAIENENKTGMILTHAYLFRDKQRFDYSKYGDTQSYSPYSYPLSSTETVNDGEDIWQKLIFTNNAIRFVLCGHMEYPDYIGNLVSVNSNNNSCLQLLFDTQTFPNGGNGWIQILEFKNDLKNVQILTYSAASDTWRTGPLHQYLFRYN